MGNGEVARESEPFLLRQNIDIKIGQLPVGLNTRNIGEAAKAHCPGCCAQHHQRTTTLSGYLVIRVLNACQFSSVATGHLIKRMDGLSSVGICETSTALCEPDPQICIFTASEQRSEPMGSA